MSDAAVRLHHPFSPSKLQYLEASPCWIPQVNTNTEASDAGTAQHDAAESHTDIDDPKLTDEQAEAVAMCKGYRDAIIAKYPGGEVIKEVYLPVDDKILKVLPGEAGWEGTTGGYLDFAVISADKKVAEIIDWKFGMWSVEPSANNLQGIAYLLGLVHRVPSLDTITVHFCMPHREEIDCHTFNRDEFQALYLRVLTVVARAQEAARTQDTSKCTATVSSCLWCGAKGYCQTLAKFALKVGNKYAPVKVPDNVIPSLLSDPKQSKTSMEIAQLMEAWAKAVRSQITARVIEDDAWMPEGYKLRSRADNNVVDWRKVLKIARSNGVPSTVINEAITVRMTPINKAVSDGAERGSKKAATEAFRDSLLDAGALEKEQPIYFLERLKT